jgi:bacteriocin-associated integral membrane protein
MLGVGNSPAAANQASLALAEKGCHVLKRILVVLLVALTGLGFAVSLLRTADDQHTAMAQAASSIGNPFAIPTDQRFADPEVISPALHDAALASHVNVFRTAFGYDAHDNPTVSHYILLTADTRFYEPFRTRSGALLSPEQTRAGDRFVATTGEVRGAQIGVLSALPGGPRVSIRPLNQAFLALPTAGSYFVECAQPSGCEAFLKGLASEINMRDQTIHATPDNFKAEGQQIAELSNGLLPLLNASIYLLIVFIALAVLYRQINEAKRSGLLQLHGMGVFAIWWRITGRLIMVVLGIASVAAMLAAALTPGATSQFISTLAAFLLRSLVITMIVSLLACPYIMSLRVAEAIKNRKDTKALFAFTMTIKVAFAVLLIVTGGSLWLGYQAAARDLKQVGSWQSTAGYGVFTPTSVGNDLIEIQTGAAGPTTAEVFDLYPMLNARGSLYVDSTAFEPAALAEPLLPGQYRSMIVNPNYLRAYPVQDTRHTPITIPESETDWIVLVPDTLRPESRAIEASFTRNRMAAPQADRALFGRDAPAAVRAQHVRIIWTAPHQKVFAFNPLINPNAGGLLDDPIIEVMTLSNSAGIDRANAISGGVDSALKVKLTDNSPIDTFVALQPELKRLKLDDNLTHLVTLDEAALQQVQRIQGNITIITVTGIGLLIIMLILALQSLALLFERFARKIVTRRLFGLSFGRRYREFLVIFGAVWVGEMAVALLANSLANSMGLNPFVSATESGAASASATLGIGVAVLTIEFLFSAAALVFIEQRRTTDVLKGEF